MRTARCLLAVGVVVGAAHAFSVSGRRCLRASSRTRVTKMPRMRPLRMSGTPNIITREICGSTCLGKQGWQAFADLMGPQFKAVAEQVALVFSENPVATQSVAIGCSLLICLTVLGSLDGEDKEDTFENREAFVKWLTRPPEEYSSDEGFNLFLVAFHGYCLYDAIKRGDFEGFSFFSFLPVLAVIVMLQIVAKLRANARGYVAPPSSEAGWKKFK